MFLTLALLMTDASAQNTIPTTTGNDEFPRAIRRTIPINQFMRRAYAAGTRDSTGRPGPKYWQMWVDYRIHTSLDEKTMSVSGTETVVVHNRSPQAFTSVMLRLDQNLFSPRVARAAPVVDVTGGMRVTRVDVNGVSARLTPFTPAERTPATIGKPYAETLDETLARVQLGRRVEPGDSVTLRFDWSFRAPQIADGRGPRMGAWGDSLIQVAQWYPRIAKLDDVRGWDLESYLGPAEFYNNFGSFDVTIDVPEGWIVGATGVLKNPSDVLATSAQQRLASALAADSVVHVITDNERVVGTNARRSSWHFIADTVNDFAWAASPKYVWDAGRVLIPGKSEPILAHALYLPSHRSKFAGILEPVRHALRFYSSLWMPYAFPQHTVVDGPEQGMEYPMLIMSGPGAADHEVGHQWWPMMVGVNETMYGFMDEGFNQYMNLLSSAAAEGTAPALDGVGQDYGLSAENEYEPPLIWNANNAGPAYALQAYRKAPAMLSMLGGVVGDSAVQRAMREYAVAWRFKHPTPHDFMFFMNRALGQNLDWFWYPWIFSRETTDGSISSVRVTGTRLDISVRQDGELPSPVVLRLTPRAGANGRLPRGATRDGSGNVIITQPASVWFDGRRSLTVTVDAGVEIESVLLDPYRRFPDRNPRDNVWKR